MFSERALAKINLTLEVLGKREDGYHELNSLVTFAEIGDEITFTPSNQNEYTLTQTGFKVESENIVLKAARLFKDRFPETPYGAFHVVKNLPVASGIGGGSADAAAALRLLMKALGKQVDLSLIGKHLGADVSVCLEQKTRFMSGIGHDLGAEIAHEKLHFVFVNPLQGVSTKEIFALLKAKPHSLNSPHPNPPLAGEGATSGYPSLLREGEGGILKIITSGKNDLQPVAIKLLPIIGDILEAIEKQNPIVARMSGSGATCFGLFETKEKAEMAFVNLKKKYPNFWII